MSAEKLTSNLAITSYDFDPDATTSTAVGWVDMRDFQNLLVQYFKTVGTGVLTSLIIKAATDNSGTNATTILTAAPAADPDAVGDYIFAEIDADDIRDAGENAGLALRYVSAYVALGTGTDEAVVTYIRSGARFPATDLTADVVA